MGGGGSSKAQDQANQAEAERQRQIAASTAEINRIFNDPSRTAQYDKLAADTTAYYAGDVNRQNVTAQRKLKFALARSGLTGSSVQASKGRQLGEDYSRALIDAARRGNSAAADLRASDENARTNLIALAQSGLDTTTASQDATRALQTGLASAQSASTVNSIGDAFGDLASIYQNSRDAQAARQGQLYGYGGLFQPLYGVGQQNPGYSY